MEENHIEKRTFSRLNVNCQATLKKNTEEYPILITNISGQGIGFQIQENLKTMEKVMIIINVSKSPTPMVLSGITTWIKDIGNGANMAGIKLDITSWMKMSEILGKK